MVKAVAVKLSSSSQKTVTESVDEELPVAVSPTGEKDGRIWQCEEKTDYLTLT